MSTIQFTTVKMGIVDFTHFVEASPLSVQALVISRLDYSSVPLAGLPASAMRSGVQPTQICSHHSPIASLAPHLSTHQVQNAGTCLHGSTSNCSFLSAINGQVPILPSHPQLLTPHHYAVSGVESFISVATFLILGAAMVE